MGTLTGTIRAFAVIRDKRAPFKAIANIAYPTSIVAKGISGSEKIAIELFIGQGEPDKNDDTQWISASFDGKALELSADSNVALVEGRAIYRLVMATSASPITVVYYDS